MGRKAEQILKGRARAVDISNMLLDTARDWLRKGLATGSPSYNIVNRHPYILRINLQTRPACFRATTPHFAGSLTPGLPLGT